MECLADCSSSLALRDSMRLVSGRQSSYVFVLLRRRYLNFLWDPSCGKFRSNLSNWFWNPCPICFRLTAKVMLEHLICWESPELHWPGPQIWFAFTPSSWLDDVWVCILILRRFSNHFLYSWYLLYSQDTAWFILICLTGIRLEMNRDMRLALSWARKKLRDAWSAFRWCACACNSF